MQTYQRKFIDSLITVSKKCERDFNIAPSFIIANAINESGWGRSKLSQYNNLFGIKYSALKSVVPKEFNIDKVEICACDGKCEYCVFKTVDQSVWCMCYYLSYRRWLSEVLVYGKALKERYHVKQFCEILGDIYAPNAKEVNGKTKGEMLIELIERYKLYVYDNKCFKF